MAFKSLLPNATAALYNLIYSSSMIGRNDTYKAFSVLFTHQKTKKNKTWQDGLLSCRLANGTAKAYLLSINTANRELIEVFHVAEQRYTHLQTGYTRYRIHGDLRYTSFCRDTLQSPKHIICLETSYTSESIPTESAECAASSLEKTTLPLQNNGCNVENRARFVDKKNEIKPYESASMPPSTARNGIQPAASTGLIADATETQLAPICLRRRGFRTTQPLHNISKVPPVSVGVFSCSTDVDRDSDVAVCFGEPFELGVGVELFYLLCGEHTLEDNVEKDTS